MFARKVSLLWAACCCDGLGRLGMGRGIPLTESKEQLGLNYEFSATAKDGTVIVQLTIKDLGKLKPLRGVLLSIPQRQEGRPPACCLRAAGDQARRRETTAWAQLSREMAKRATVQLVPENPPDGGKMAGGVWYPIAVREHIKDAP